jgi:hypothetical protein
MFGHGFRLTLLLTQNIVRLSLALSPFSQSAASGMLKYIATISSQLEMLHLLRKSGARRDRDIKPRFAEGILNLTFPKLHSFALEDRSGDNYQKSTMGFWQRHPKLCYVDIRRNAGVDDPLFLDHNECIGSEGMPLLPNLRYLTVSSLP